MKAIYTIALLVAIAAVTGCTNDDGWSDQSNYDSVSHNSSAYDPASNTLGPTSADEAETLDMVPPLDAGNSTTSDYPTRDERLRSFEDASSGNLSSSSDSSYTPTAPSGGRMYMIKRGDTLWAIAERHLGSGQRWREIAELNPGLDPAKLAIGQEIRLPLD